MEGKFEVIWEMNGHCYPNEAIKQGVKEKFDFDQEIDEPTAPESKPFSDFFQSKEDEYTTKAYVWNHPLAKMEVEHSPQVDMEQTEGRFLREDEIYKPIYRTHNVQIKPYPIRIYQSWKLMFEQVFEGYISPLDLLKPKEREIYDWIKENYNHQEFSVNDISDGLNLDQDNIRSKYLKKLVDLQLLEKRELNRKNYYRLITLD